MAVSLEKKPLPPPPPPTPVKGWAKIKGRFAKWNPKLRLAYLILFMACVAFIAAFFYEDELSGAFAALNNPAQFLRQLFTSSSHEVTSSPQVYERSRTRRIINAAAHYVKSESGTFAEKNSQGSYIVNFRDAMKKSGDTELLNDLIKNPNFGHFVLIIQPHLQDIEKLRMLIFIGDAPDLDDTVDGLIVSEKKEQIRLKFKSGLTKQDIEGMPEYKEWHSSPEILKPLMTMMQYGSFLTLVEVRYDRNIKGDSVTYQKKSKP